MKRPLPLIIAHRGESFDAPENTMAAFDLAWQHGDAAIEFDVQVTLDGQIVLCHDDDTRRVTGQLSNLIIKNTSFVDLHSLDIGSWKSSKYSGEKMPLLSDVLERMPGGKIAFIEIKPSVENIRPVIAVMKASGRADAEMRMISFTDSIIAQYKQLWPDGPEAYLLAAFDRDQQSNQWGPTTEELISRARACQAVGLDLQNNEPFDETMVREIHAAGLQCYVWTEDNPEAARRCMSMGVDGITTNRAEWVAKQSSPPSGF